MCSNPIYIDNPYLGLANVGHNKLHDTVSLKIPVPCGNCPTCVRLRQSYLVQRCQMESLDNHLFFATFTYNDKHVPRLSVNGFDLMYPDFKHIQNMMKRIRKYDDLKSFRYLVVSEYGGKRHRPHFHMILSYPNSGETYGQIRNLERKLYSRFLFEWRVNKGSTRNPDYMCLSDYIVTRKGRTFDFHYVNPRATKNGEEDVAFYVTKYVLKASDYVDSLKSALKLNLDPEKFVKFWRLLKPRCNISKGFGNPTSKKVKDHIRRGIDHSVESDELLYPIFINPVTGSTFPLSPYYRRKFLTVDDMYRFLAKNKDSDIDNFKYTDEYDPREVRQKFESYLKTIGTVNARNNNDSFIHENPNYEDSQFLFEVLENPFDCDSFDYDCFGSFEDFQ